MYQRNIKRKKLTNLFQSTQVQEMQKKLERINKEPIQKESRETESNQVNRKKFKVFIAVLSF